MLDQKSKMKDREEIDKRYKAALDKTRNDVPTERIDPWSNMRGTDNSKTKR